MKRPLPIMITSIALLVPAAPAAAKEVVKAKVCGASDCREITDRHTLAALPEGGDPTDPPSHSSGWYRVTLTVRSDDAHDRFTNAVLPAARYIRGEGENGHYTWMPMTARATAAYRSAVRGLRPFAGSRLRGLDDRMPPARVVEVYAPAARAKHDDDGGVPAWLAALAGSAAAGLAGALLLRRRWLPFLRARRAS
jgi:hypothetical protein